MNILLASSIFWREILFWFPNKRFSKELANAIEKWLYFAAMDSWKRYSKLRQNLCSIQCSWGKMIRFPRFTKKIFRVSGNRMEEYLSLSPSLLSQLEFRLLEWFRSIVLNCISHSYVFFQDKIISWRERGEPPASKFSSRIVSNNFISILHDCITNIYDSCLIPSEKQRGNCPNSKFKSKMISIDWILIV